jgi:multidrug efflux pump
VIAGTLSMLQIPKESSPDIEFGIISINTPYSGVNPGDIDSLITEKIEKEIKDIEGISKITSSSVI